MDGTQDYDQTFRIVAGDGRERWLHGLARRVRVGDIYRFIGVTYDISKERAALAEDGRLTIDIPYGALEMLSSAAQDRVFYRVDGPPRQIVTGYADLPVAAALPGGAPALPGCSR